MECFNWIYIAPKSVSFSFKLQKFIMEKCYGMINETIFLVKKGLRNLFYIGRWCIEYTCKLILLIIEDFCLYIMHCSSNLWVQKIKKYINYQYSCCRESSCRGYNSNARRTSPDQSLWCEKAIGCIKISGNPRLWLVNRRGRARWGRSKTSIVRFHKKLAVVKKE